MKKNRCLVLNSDYRPLGIVGRKRAISMYVVSMTEYAQEFTDLNVNVVEFYDNEYILGASGKKYKVPAVLSKVDYVSRKKKVPFSRKNVFIRDNLTCQYCGDKFDPNELTYDHVIPRAKWKRQNHKISPTQWLNIVTACQPCNLKKANKTPKEANMVLIRDPYEPDPNTYVPGLAPWMDVPEEWKMYLPQFSKMFKENLIFN